MRDVSLGNLLACLPDPAALTDAAGHLLAFNARFCAAARAAEVELCGQPIQRFVHAPPPDRALTRVFGHFVTSAEPWHGYVVFGRRGTRGRRSKLHIGRVDDRGHPHLLFVLRDLGPEEHLHRRLVRAARTDALTQLLNRGAFAEVLELAVLRAQTDDGRLALLFADLDGFKVVNDANGHDTGDRVLVEIARRFRTAVGQDGTVARWGGDEFACLVHETADGGRGVDVAERLLAEATRRLPEPMEAALGASIGIARLPEDATTTAALTSAADQALYAAKAQGGGWRAFAPDLAARARERHRLRSDLRRATRSDELQLYYQPLVDARTLEPCGVEALVRWRHPERGLLTPGAFLGLLTNAADMSLRLLEIQVRRATADLAAIAAVAPALALNLDARLVAFAEVTSLLSPLHAALDARGRTLAVELTEASFGEHPAKLQRFVHSVRRAGMRLAIDDFGGGQASLLRLREISFDILKVDRAFVRSITVSARDRTISGLAAKVAAELSGTSVAEGIETAGQAAWARTLGYDALQGFRIARPMPPSALAGWHRRWTTSERGRLQAEIDAAATTASRRSRPHGLSPN